LVASELRRSSYWYSKSQARRIAASCPKKRFSGFFPNLARCEDIRSWRSNIPPNSSNNAYASNRSEPRSTKATVRSYGRGSDLIFRSGPAHAVGSAISGAPQAHRSSRLSDRRLPAIEMSESSRFPGRIVPSCGYPDRSAADGFGRK
jgi:hypothetical protein